jgi:methionyl aminopeptidase
MVNLGGHRIFTDRDGWTIKTDDGSPSVHFEKMVAVGDGKPDVLTPYSYIALNKVFYGQTV